MKITLVTLFFHYYRYICFYLILLKIKKLAFSEYIKNLLLYNGKVTFPGLGSLTVIKESARMKGKKIIPPGTGILFNPDITLDDGKLAQSVASAEEMDIEEARQKVLELVDKILFSLNKEEAFVFEGTGKLFKDENNVLHFEKDPAFILDFDSFGLESFELEPREEEVIPDEHEPHEEEVIPEGHEPREEEVIPDETTQPDVPKSEVNIPEEHPVIDIQAEDKLKPEIEYRELKKERSWGIFKYVVGMAGIILIGLIVLNLTTDLLDNTPFRIFNLWEKDSVSVGITEAGPEVKDDLEKALDSISETEVDLIPLQKEEIPVKRYEAGTRSYKEYHIIAGSFRDMFNAQELARELTLKGYPVVMIEQDNNLYRVSAMSFTDKESGMKELARFRAQTRNNAAWLLGLD